MEVDHSEGELDALWAHAYTVSTLVEMSAEPKANLSQAYATDPFWVRVSEVLDNNDAAGEDAAKLPFFRGTDGLFRRIDDTTSANGYTPRRLCIPKDCVKEFFDIAHSSSYIGRDRCHEIISR